MGLLGRDGDVELLDVLVSGPPPLGEIVYAFEPGVTVLFGRNGAGKTRLLSALAAALRGGTRMVDRSRAFVRVLVARPEADDFTKDQKYEPYPEYKSSNWLGPVLDTEGLEADWVRPGHFAEGPQRAGRGTVFVLLEPRRPHWSYEPHGWSVLPGARDAFAPDPEHRGPLINALANRVGGALVEEFPEEVPQTLGPITIIDLDHTENLDRSSLDRLMTQTTAVVRRGEFTSEMHFDELSDGARRLSEAATSFYAKLGPGELLLEYRMGAPWSWMAGQVPHWVAFESARRPGLHGFDDASVTLDRLSHGQGRWARTAAYLAITEIDDRPTVLIMDEPEAGLERSTAAALPGGLVDVLEEMGPSVELIAATHSPFLLASPDVRKFHVHRSGEGTVQIGSSEVDVTGGLGTELALEVFGLVKSDLWDLTRLFVFVEGPHDVAVLSSLLGDALVQSGARMVALGGGKQAVAPAAPLFAAMTRAGSLVVLDNLAAAEVDDLWTTALHADLSGDADGAREALRRLKASHGHAERQYLANLGFAMLDANRSLASVRWFGMSAPDVLCYLPVTDFAPRAPTWQELAEQKRKDQSLKDHLIKQYRNGVPISSEEVETAAMRARSRPLPDDLLKLRAAIMDAAAANSD